MQVGNQILIVDDEVGIRELLSEILQDEGYTVHTAGSAAEARAFRDKTRPDLVLLDIWMPECDGVTLLKEWARTGQLSMPVVMMSGHATIDTAVEATRIGAFDFMEKPIALQKLLVMVARAMKSGVTQSKTDLSLARLGKSASVAQLRQRLDQIAQLKAPVLLTGKPGVGFEAAARYLHAPTTPWVTPENQDAIGSSAVELLRQASNGLLFVREIGHLSERCQQGMRQMLQQLEKHNVRLVCATTRPLAEMLRDPAWDAHLLNQLASITVPVPALSEHSEDVVDLANQILSQMVESKKVPPRRFTVAALNTLRNHAWPGNIDQLNSVVHTLALTSTQEDIDSTQVQQALAQYKEPTATEVPEGVNISFDLPLREARDQFERMYFEYQIQKEHGNMSRVAEKAGLERTHLYRKLKQLGIKPGRKTSL